jgi:hypothetical protein
MGYVRHNAIIATTWQEHAATALAEFARSIGAQALVAEEVTNGYITVCIPPDGSKEGWEESDSGDGRRARIKAWLTSQTDLYFEWCEVAYGDDDSAASVVTSAWTTAQEPTHDR